MTYIYTYLIHNVVVLLPNWILVAYYVSILKLDIMSVWQQVTLDGAITAIGNSNIRQRYQSIRNNTYHIHIQHTHTCMQAAVVVTYNYQANDFRFVVPEFIASCCRFVRYCSIVVALDVGCFSASK